LDVHPTKERGVSEWRSPVHYSDYLQLDQLLSCQRLESERHGAAVHDEMLFVIVHQAYELWFKQILWEMDAVLAIFRQPKVREREMGRAVSHLARIVEIQRLMLAQLDVLETMTPLDFLDFREFLVPASGFQSVQFRLVENKLGMVAGKRLRINDVPYTQRLPEAERQRVEASEKEPSLFDVVHHWLERTPFLRFGEFDFWKEYRAAVDGVLAKDHAIIEANTEPESEERKQILARHAATVRNFAELFEENRAEDPAEVGRRFSLKARLAALLINLYRDEPILHLPFRLLTVLMDIDEGFTNWRYRHALMVMRMIGSKMGTGGSSGTEYLRQTAEQHKIFSDLISLSTYFLPRSALPTLPPEVVKTMSFQFTDG
jgi:tryptophan 2,3-dioxygenase